MDTKWFKLVFVNIHIPTEEKNDNDKDEFYTLLDEILNEIPQGRI